MSDFIRGGQVTFHKFRMLMQVSRVMTRLSLLLILLSIGYSYYKHISYDEWKIGFTWLRKDFLQDTQMIEYRTKYSTVKTATVAEFKHDPYVMRVAAKFETVLYKGLILSSIMLVTIIGGLLVFFWVRGVQIKKTRKLRGVFLLQSKKLKKKDKFS
jgi:cellobiose-specific phosphotransferase system component IIC